MGRTGRTNPRYKLIAIRQTPVTEPINLALRK